ncbi:histidine phosphatase family protein [Phyllobacterium sp. 628]|uniref:histidine phosphatase family protein n=1 Tax=Phyllobacterium sp. 628 TaxID=2718938 RepID=UPI00353012BA
MNGQVAISVFSQGFSRHILAKATRLTLVCHGTTSATRSGAFPLDEALEPGEFQRVQNIAGQLRRAHRVFRGPELRTQQTVETLALEASVEMMLADIDYGRWAGRGFADIHADEVENIAIWLSDPDLGSAWRRIPDHISCTHC